MDGDITKAQIEASLEWVNSLLEKPVSLPDRCIPEKLLNRMRPAAASDAEALALFLNLNMAPLKPALGQFLQSRFKPQTIRDYWRTRMSQNTVGTVGMSWALKDYLNLANPLEWLRDIYPFPEKEYPAAVKKLIRQLLKMGITEEGSLSDIMEVNNPENSMRENSKN